MKYLILTIFCFVLQILFPNEALAQFSDCATAQILCSKDSVEIQSVTGPGTFENIVANSCFQDQEHQSHWFTFYATSSGSFEMSIRAKNYGADYDFAMWEGGCPGSAGSNLVACSWLGGVIIPPYNATGIASDPAASFGESLNLEFIPTINIKAGKLYYILVDNITANSVGFTIRFGGTANIGAAVLNYSAGIFCNQKSVDLKTIQVIGLDSVPGTAVYYSKFLDATKEVNPLASTVVSTSGNYYVTKTTPHGCKTTQTITVTIENPDIVVNDVFTCGVSPFDLNNIQVMELSGLDITGFSFSFFKTQQDLLNNTNPLSNIISNSGTVWLKAVSPNGCSDNVPFNVMLEKPTMTLSGSKDICPGNSVVLPIVYNGQWPINVTILVNGAQPIKDFVIKGEPIVVQPQKTSIYTVQEAIDTLGCKADVSGIFKVVVHDIPQIQNVVTDCSSFGGQPVLKITVSGGDTISYSLIGVNGSFNSNVFTSLPLVEGSTYSFQLEDKYKCGQGIWMGEIKCNCDTSFKAEIVEINKIKCFGDQNGKLSANISGGTMPYNYLWSDGSVTTTIDNLKSGSYQLQVTDANACTTKYSFILEQPNEITSSFLIDSITCKGMTNGAIEILNPAGGTGKLIVTNGINVLNQAPYKYTNLSAGIYEISIVDDNNCMVKQKINLPDGKGFNLTLGNDKTVGEGEIANINVIGDINKIDNIVWTSNFTIPCTQCTEFEIIPSSSGQISFVAYSLNGCTSSDSLLIHYKGKSLAEKVYIPNTFSPNGDGINDIFKPYIADDVICTGQFKVFNRWGGQIYNEIFTKELTGWNGRLEAQYLNAGVYVFTLELIDLSGEHYLFKGDITLLR